MKIGIIVNEKSGSVPEGGRLQLQEFLQEAGHMPVLAPEPDGDLNAQVDALAEASLDAIAVWGGDGTICTVLQKGEDTPILILPGGTMNLLPKRLHDGELDWRKVVASVLENPTSTWIPAGEIAGRRFFVAALFGQLTHIGESREAVREGALLQAVSILTEKGALDIETSLQIEVDLPEESRDCPATAVAVMPGEEGGLEVAVVAPDNHLDLAASALDAMFRGWRESAHFHAAGANAVRIRHVEQDTISATLDGEPCEPGESLSISYVPKAACVLVSGGEV